MNKIVELNAAEQAAVGGAGLLQELLEEAARALRDYIERQMEPQI